MRAPLYRAALAVPATVLLDVSGSAARRVLHDVYASPDFSHLDDAGGPGWLSSVISFLGKLLRAGVGALGPVGAILLAVAVVGLGVALLWRRWRGDAALGGAGIREPAAAGDDPEVEWRAAELAAAAGDHREAVRRAFRSALLDVAIRGRVQVDAAWTTRELLERCRADGDVLVALAGAAGLFDRAWYSGLAVTATDWDAARERCTALRRLARQSRVASP